MNLKDVSYSEEEKKDMSTPSLVSELPKYPYGLKITLEPDVLDKLELYDAPKVGEKKMILAIAEVVAVRKEDGRGDVKKFSVELQIQQLDCKKEEADGQKVDAAKSLYGSGE